MHLDASLSIRVSQCHCWGIADLTPLPLSIVASTKLAWCAQPLRLEATTGNSILAARRQGNYEPQLLVPPTRRRPAAPCPPSRPVPRRRHFCCRHNRLRYQAAVAGPAPSRVRGRRAPQRRVAAASGARRSRGPCGSAGSSALLAHAGACAPNAGAASPAGVAAGDACAP
jgi:hypothetical protein